MVVQLAVEGAASPALLSLVLGCVVLLCGDKVVRPLVARHGIRLPFVWVLMACLGGFGVLGLAGLVIGPVVISLCGRCGRNATRTGRTLLISGTDAADAFGSRPQGGLIPWTLRTCCGRPCRCPRLHRRTRRARHGPESFCAAGRRHA